MTVATLPTPTTVHIEDHTVVFDGFHETDPGVVDAIAGVPDAEACAHELLRLGARLSGLATGASSLAELEGRVGDRLEALASSARTSVAEATAVLTEQSRALFSADGGEAAVALTRWRTELDAHLGELFDPAHKRSVIAALEQSLTAMLDAHGRRLVATTDPDDPASTAGRLLAQVRQHAEGLREEMHALAHAVGAQAGRSAEHARTAVKGLEFEPVVFDEVLAFAAPFGDRVEHVGTTAGVRGNKKGDICVTVAEDDLAGEVGRYAVEAKHRKLSLQATWRELDAVMANREAAAAIAVFASGSLSPTTVPFFYSGERAVVVLDCEDPDPAALQLACLFARWVVRRSAAPPGHGPDAERMVAALDRAQRALARVSTIRRCLSGVVKGADGAREELEELAAELRAALAELAVELGR